MLFYRVKYKWIMQYIKKSSHNSEYVVEVLMKYLATPC